MELNLLGPFELRADGVPLVVRGRGERALLALLALSAGRVVAATTLIEALWAVDELPADPVNALQLRVSKLRRSIGAVAPVCRQGAGYRLEVGAEDVDVARFVALIETARRIGDPRAATDRYEQALQLWRAEPFVDFAGDPWTLIESARLVELRLAAVAERADRMLTLGRYEQLVADLEPVVARAPTRERLVGQLMTALFNAGRQAEALEMFAQTRQLLADELGIDPSRELRAVMEQILRQDPAITPTQAATGRDQAAGNLPSRTTSFVGRAGELARTLDLLRHARLITLVGAGGAGKTALGIEAARAAAPRFRDGAWLVRLAAVTEPEILIHTIADALDLSMEGGTATRRPSDLLVRHLGARDVLVVLDNCEHLIEPIATLVEAVLGRCPDLRIMTTSREALAVPGEVQLAVGPLAVPHPGTPPARVPSFPAPRLFLDRAHETTPDLVLDDDELAAVGVISRRLDGIPLALELAAARLASLTPRELANRVVDRFAVLTSGSRTADARQQTLRNTVDWSHELLTGPERVLFRRLAVFRGGWTLTAAEDVVTGPDLPEGAVLDLLERLVRQSLVAADKTAGHTRYRMLETLREYAAGQLRQAGEDDPLADAHAAHFLRMGEDAESGLRGPSQSGWLQRLDREHANLRAALRRFQNPGGNTDGALRLAGSLGLYWHMGRHLEGREALHLVMASPGGSPAARGRALQAVSLVERPRACMVHPSSAPPQPTTV